ncbi:MAG: hypothetical protein V3T05_12955 [Myxococcota bacterium]
MRRQIELTIFAALVVAAAGCGESLAPVPEPVLEISSPVRAAFVERTDGDLVRVRGRAVHIPDLVGVTLGEAPVILAPDGSFVVEVSPELGINELHLVATRAESDPLEVRQSYLYGELRREEHPMMHTHFGPGLFAYGGAFGADLLVDGLQDGTFVSEVTFSEGVPQCDAVVIHSITATGVDVGVVPQTGLLALTAEIDTDPTTRLDVDFTAHNCTFLGLTVDGNMTAASADLAASVLLSSDSHIGVEITDVVVSLNDFDVDLDTDLYGLGGEVIQYLAEDAITDAVRDALIEKMAPLMQDELNALLGRHELTTIDTPAGAVRAVTNVTLVGKDGVPALDTRPTGVEFMAEMEMMLEPADPTAELVYLHDGPGPWYLGSGPPPPPETGEFVISVSQSMINAMLFDLWRVGLLDRSVDLGETAELLGEPLNTLQAARIEVSAMLPPVVTSSAESPEVLVLQVGDLLVHLYEGEALQATLAINAQLSLRLIRFESAEILVVGVSVGEVTLAGSTLDAPGGDEIPKALHRLLTRLGPDMIESFVESKASVQIPTPTAIRFDQFEARLEGGLLSFIATPADEAP